MLDHAGVTGRSAADSGPWVEVNGLLQSATSGRSSAAKFMSATTGLKVKLPWNAAGHRQDEAGRDLSRSARNPVNVAATGRR